MQVASPDPDSPSATLVRVSVPDQTLLKCLLFDKDATVWTAKRIILDKLAKGLVDSENYGLFIPGENGKVGKFMSEERLLGDYPLPGPVASLEFRYKRRMLLDDTPAMAKARQKANSKSSLKKFIEATEKRNVTKVADLLAKGTDPNFHDEDTGETPLAIASTQNDVDMVTKLVESGAFADFRSKDGLSPVHKAAIKGSHKALRALLDLRASPDIQDPNGLTPLYLNCMQGADVRCAELLLQDRAHHGITDAKDWSELHQASKFGFDSHVNMLCIYGADINARNSAGNTPLHVCATWDKPDCAKTLLTRGADCSAKNRGGQTPFQIATIAGAHDVMAILKKYNNNGTSINAIAPKYIERSNSGMTSDRGLTSRGAKQQKLFATQSSAIDMRPNPGAAASEAVYEIPRTQQLVYRTVIIPKGKSGYGFRLAGNKCSAVDQKDSGQVISQCEPDGPAQKSGLRPGDRLIKVNDIDVMYANHQRVVDLIRLSKGKVKLVVADSGRTVDNMSSDEAHRNTNIDSGHIPPIFSPVISPVPPPVLADSMDTPPLPPLSFSKVGHTTQKVEHDAEFLPPPPPPPMPVVNDIPQKSSNHTSQVNGHTPSKTAPTKSSTRKQTLADAHAAELAAAIRKDFRESVDAAIHGKSSPRMKKAGTRVIGEDGPVGESKSAAAKQPLDIPPRPAITFKKRPQVQTSAVKTKTTSAVPLPERPPITFAKKSKSGNGFNTDTPTKVIAQEEKTDKNGISIDAIPPPPASLIADGTNDLFCSSSTIDLPSHLYDVTHTVSLIPPPPSVEMNQFPEAVPPPTDFIFKFDNKLDTTSTDTLDLPPPPADMSLPPPSSSFDLDQLPPPPSPGQWDDVLEAMPPPPPPDDTVVTASPLKPKKAAPPPPVKSKQVTQMSPKKEISNGNGKIIASAAVAKAIGSVAAKIQDVSPQKNRLKLPSPPVSSVMTTSESESDSDDETDVDGFTSPRTNESLGRITPLSPPTPKRLAPPPPKVLPKPTITLKRMAICAFKFEARNQDELTFKPGQKIELLETPDEGGWWKGAINDQSGWFPSNHVRELVAPPGLKKRAGGPSLTSRKLVRSKSLSGALNLAGQVPKESEKATGPPMPVATSSTSLRRSKSTRDLAALAAPAKGILRSKSSSNIQQDAASDANPMEWSVARVGKWLDMLGLPEYVETFADNEIEGKHLIDLEKDDLKELGVTILGHRMTLAKAIAKIKKELPDEE